MSLRSARLAQIVEPFAGAVVVAVVIGGGLSVRSWRHRSTPHVSGTKVEAPASVTLAFDLSEAAEKVGIRFTHHKAVPHPSLRHIAPFLAGLAGASVAVVDFDGDGFPDVYLTSQERGTKNALFRNNHDGTFSEVGDAAGLSEVNKTTGSLFAAFIDYDNDGHEDMVLLTTWCPRVFHNRGDGTFADVTDHAGLGHCGNAHALNAIDYDGDGYLDLIVADYYKPVDVYAPATLDFMWNRLHYADNGGPITVYHNNRDGTFSEVPGALGFKSRGFTNAIGVYDLRGTGRRDVFFATDFNPDQLYLNEGGGRFVDASERFLGPKYSGSGINAEIADVDNDGHPAVYVTDIHEPGFEVNRNALWKTTDGGLENISIGRGVDHCGWAWGAKFVDLDNDGWLDLVVSNGMVSASRDKDYWYRMGTMESDHNAWMSDATKWPAFGDASWAGHERKCVFYHGPDKFVDVSALTALGDDESDGRGLAAIDYLNDGSQSLVEAVVGDRARFYKNTQKNRNHWIGFALTGTRSNRDAFGAKVTVRIGRDALTRELEPLNGFETQSDRRLHFGIGPATATGRVTVRWPSGLTQELDGLAVDRYHALTEPRG